MRPTPENLQNQEVMMHLNTIVTAVMRMTVEVEAWVFKMEVTMEVALRYYPELISRFIFIESPFHNFPPTRARLKQYAVSISLFIHQKYFLDPFVVTVCLLFLNSYIWNFCCSKLDTCRSPFLESTNSSFLIDYLF